MSPSSTTSSTDARTVDRRAAGQSERLVALEQPVGIRVDVVVGEDVLAEPIGRRSGGRPSSLERDERLLDRLCTDLPQDRAPIIGE